MTKEELKKELSAQKALKNFFSLTGKRWVSYKAGQFAVSDDIIYIPGISWFSANKNKHSEEEINNILRWCLTGNDFIRICNGHEGLAKGLFEFVGDEYPNIHDFLEIRGIPYSFHAAFLA